MRAENGTRRNRGKTLQDSVKFNMIEEDPSVITEEPCGDGSPRHGLFFIFQHLIKHP